MGPAKDMRNVGWMSFGLSDMRNLPKLELVKLTFRPPTSSSSLLSMAGNSGTSD